MRVENSRNGQIKNDPSKLVPYLDGRAIRGNYPEEIHASNNHLQFHLEITPENKQAWIDLLGAPHGRRRPVAFSVGLENHSPFDSVFDQNNPGDAHGNLTRLRRDCPRRSFLLTLILFIWLARTTNLIRERGDSTLRESCDLTISAARKWRSGFS